MYERGSVDFLQGYRDCTEIALREIRDPTNDVLDQIRNPTTVIFTSVDLKPGIRYQQNPLPFLSFHTLSQSRAAPYS